MMQKCRTIMRYYEHISRCYQVISVYHDFFPCPGALWWPCHGHTGAGWRRWRKHNGRLDRMRPYVACQQSSRKAYIQGRVMDAHGVVVAYMAYRCYSACDHL